MLCLFVVLVFLVFFVGLWYCIGFVFVDFYFISWWFLFVSEVVVVMMPFEVGIVFSCVFQWVFFVQYDCLCGVL